MLCPLSSFHQLVISPKNPELSALSLLSSFRLLLSGVLFLLSPFHFPCLLLSGLVSHPLVTSHNIITSPPASSCFVSFSCLLLFLFFLSSLPSSLSFSPTLLLVLASFLLLSGLLSFSFITSLIQYSPFLSSLLVLFPFVSSPLPSSLSLFSCVFLSSLLSRLLSLLLVSSHLVLTCFISSYLVWLSLFLSPFITPALSSSHLSSRLIFFCLILYPLLLIKMWWQAKSSVEITAFTLSLLWISEQNLMHYPNGAGCLAETVLWRTGSSSVCRQTGHGQEKGRRPSYISFVFPK